jgi:hypothetical protein
MKKKFLICPVRNQDKKTLEIINKFIDDPDVYYPKRDTEQNDPTGVDICKQNREAIRNAEEILFIWDGKSEGCLFDLGMAFAMNKKVTVVSVPPPTEGKSFQNMVTAYANSENASDGYGNCPDCVWFHQLNGCNTQRDSETCRINKISITI